MAIGVYTANIVTPTNGGDADSLRKSVFLAGSIEMDKADKWQKKIEEIFEMYRVTLINPRREKWDASLEQTSSNEVLRDQIIWEQKYLDKADIVFFYFDPNSVSPISLLELGECLGKRKDLVVVCPKGYFRYPNVEITCQLHKVTVHYTLEDGINHLKVKLNTYKSK